MKKSLVPWEAPAYQVDGLTGATSSSRYVGGTASGAPTSGTFLAGDFIVARNGHIWVCTTGGTPGTWVDAGSFGSGGGTPATTVQTESGLDSGQVGTSTNYAREDHRHPITNVVDLASTQTVSGVKTFSSGLVANQPGLNETSYGNLGTFVGGAVAIAPTNAATSTNVVVESFLSVGFNFWTGSVSTAGSVVMKATALSSAGTGALAVNGQLYEFSNRVFSAANPPNASNIGAGSFPVTAQYTFRPSGQPQTAYGVTNIFSTDVSLTPQTAATATNLAVDSTLVFGYNYWTGSASAAGSVFVKATAVDSAGNGSLMVSGRLNTIGNLTEAGNRVYSAANGSSGTVASGTSWGVSAGAGSATTYSRGDHTHGTPAAPVTSLAAGTGISLDASTGAVTVSNTGPRGMLGVWRQQTTVPTAITATTAETAIFSGVGATFGSFTFVSGRRYRMSLLQAGTISTVASGTRLLIQVRVGSGLAGAVIGQYNLPAASNAAQTVSYAVELACPGDIAAGAQTFTISGTFNVSNTFTPVAASGNIGSNARLLFEDIGT